MYALTPHSSYRWRGREDIEPIKVGCITTNHLQVKKRESHRAQSGVCVATHQLHVERRGES